MFLIRNDLIKYSTKLINAGLLKQLTVEDITYQMREFYEFEDRDGNHSNCPQLYEDINIINESYEIEKIIATDNNNFHLLSEEAAQEYANKLKTQALKRLRKYWNIQKKIDNNGLQKFISTKGDPIDEQSKARHFVEAFLNELDTL